MTGLDPATFTLRELASGADLVGTALVVVELDDADWEHAAAARAALETSYSVKIGVASGPVPDHALDFTQALTVTVAPAGPGQTFVAPRGDLDQLAALRAAVDRSPQAALTLASTLGTTSRCSVQDGLSVESLAYSVLLGGQEFGAWRGSRPRRPVPESSQTVALRREGGLLEVRLNRPDRHNAFDRSMRHGIVEAMRVVELDPSITSAVLCGAGPSFCSGGDLDEFGTTTDLVAAHAIRMQESAALAVHRVADRVVARLHGACIGAGIEVPSFAGRVEAREDAWFMLPEVSMGLIPGAGGTVGVTRRIGRWRTAYLALTGDRIDVDTALHWGLVDARA